MNGTFTPNGKTALENILCCLKQADAAFATLTADENKACFDFHNENTSLNHCIRWGLQAAEEIQASCHNVPSAPSV